MRPQNSEIVYRRATPADKDAIWRVRTVSIKGLCGSHYRQEQVETWANVPPPDDFADVIGKRDFLVAECQREIVGFGFVNRERAEFEAIFIAPEFARRGIGTAILTALEEIARHAGLQRLTLSSSLNAVSFYRAAGYRAIEETTWHHPAGFSLECVAMTKEL
jgi:GNAT superfamily N-acetyltransferase